MSVKVYAKDIINSNNKLNGNIFEWDYKNASDNQKNYQAKGIKVAYDTTWVPILFKKVDNNGNITKVSINALDFEKVLISSKPSKPSKDDGKDEKIKCMLLVIKKLSMDEIRTGDYVPKVKDTQEEQEVENKRMEELTEILYNNTNEFSEALNIIATGFELLCKDISEQFVKDPYGFKFNMIKEPNWVLKEKDGSIKMYNPPVRSIRQTHRKDDTNPNKMIELENPLFRLKMPVYENKMLVSWRSKNGNQETAEYIYDARKTIIDGQSGKCTLVPARVKNVSGSSRPLDVDNVDKFITYKSMISGRISFPKLIISKQGLSLVNEFKQLVVKRHKAKTQRDTTVSTTTLTIMKGDPNSEDEEVLEEEISDLKITDEPVVKKSAPQVVKRILPRKNTVVSDSDDDLSV
jgi:hypothetical protein